MRLLNGKQIANATVTPAKLNFAGFSPSASTDPATVGYVEGRVNGLLPKDPVRVATTANIALTGLQNIDGVLLTANGRVLVKNQTNPVDNGIYSARAGAWVRAADFNDIGSNNVTRGSFAFVQSGTENGGTGWFVSNPGAGDLVVGTDPLLFSQVSKVTAYVAGNNIIITGNTIGVDLDNYEIVGSGIIKDNRADGNSIGFQYENDLSAFFQDNSLVSKKFVVDTIAQALSGGISLPVWSDTDEYELRSLVLHDNGTSWGLYLSLADDNVGITPGTDPAKWQNLGGTGGGSTEVTVDKVGSDVDGDGNLDLSAVAEISAKPKHPTVYVDGISGSWPVQYNKGTKIISGLYGIDAGAVIEIIF